MITISTFIEANIIRQVLALFILILFTAFTKPHPVSITFCHMYISNEYVVANLIVPIEDLVLFQYIGVDSTRNYSIDEIKKAGLAYKKELSENFQLHHNKGKIELVELVFKEEILDIDTVMLTELMKYQLEYSLKFKLDEKINKIFIRQDIGKKFPLIPALMVLDIEGEQIEKKEVDLKKGVEFPIFLTPQENKIESASIFIEDQGADFAFSLQIPQQDVTETGESSSIIASPSKIIESFLKINCAGQELSPEDIQQVQNENKTINTFTFYIQKTSRDPLELTWQVFNRNLKIIPIIYQNKSGKTTLRFSRFKDTILLKN